MSRSVLVISALLAAGTMARQLPAQQPSRTIAGRVVSAASGEPIVRDVISITGTLTQTTSDEQGRFRLPADSARSTITIQALGYREKAVTPGALAPPAEIALELAWSAAPLRAFALQQDDPDYRPVVPRPAFARGQGPRVLIDEGHHNAHTANGRYRAFASILELDGYRVEPSGTALVDEHLRHADLVVIATPIDGLADGSTSPGSPFRPAEVDALHRWVEQGGALLIVADHMPIAAALDPLLRAFGVAGDNGYVLPFEADRPVLAPIVFRRSDASLRGHPITTGRTPGERIDSVATFTGFAFRAPPDFEPLLVLRNDAWAIHPPSWLEPTFDSPRIPVGGWLQAAAARVGRGRLVINGEAAMFTAQVRGENRRKSGLTSPEARQNLRFLLNIAHWLSGLLD